MTARTEEPGSLRADNGSAPLEFLLAALGGLLVTGAALILSVAGFVRLAEVDAVASASRQLMLADASPISDASLESAIRTNLATNPIRLNLLSVSSVISSGVGAVTGSGSAKTTVLSVKAKFAIPGLESLPFFQEVDAHATAELD